MYKRVSLILIFCIQFALWTNLAMARQYTPINLEQPTITYSLDSNQLMATLLKSDIKQDEQFVVILETEESTTQPLSIDLCLPEVIIKHNIAMQRHTALRNNYCIFSAITWQPLSTLKPPIL